MRNFHTGGIAGAADITQGLPRVEEIFEARRPKKTATLAEFSGMVRIQDAKRSRNVIITGDDGEDHVYPIPYGTKVLPEDGSYIMRGELITEGNLLLQILQEFRVLKPHTTTLPVKYRECTRARISRSTTNISRLSLAR
jgi:DNA-directed RNA polymerase subunit beta'